MLDMRTASGTAVPSVRTQNQTAVKLSCQARLASMRIAVVSAMGTNH